MIDDLICVLLLLAVLLLIGAAWLGACEVIDRVSGGKLKSLIYTLFNYDPDED